MARCPGHKSGSFGGRASVRNSAPGKPRLLRIGCSELFCCARNLAPVLLFETQEDSMLQLLDLAKENAELKRELTRVRQEAEARFTASSPIALFRVLPARVRTSTRPICRRRTRCPKESAFRNQGTVE